MNKKTQHVVTAGLIAALYAALTYLSAAFGLAYGQVQIRLSEVLCVLTAFTPAAVPGLAVGCLIGNSASPLGFADIIVGTAATLISAIAGRALRNANFNGIPLLLPMPFVVINMLFIGTETALLAGSDTAFAVFATNATFVGVGQIIACYLLGIPFYMAVSRSNLAKFFADKN